jgi:hypothetical protein
MDTPLQRPLRGLNLKVPEEEVKDFCDREMERAELSQSGLERDTMLAARDLLLEVMAEVREGRRS